MLSRRLYLVNDSTLVTDTEVRKMVAAINKQLRDHFAPAWGHSRIVVEYHSGDLTDVQDEVAPGSWVMAILDNSDQAGALGWHSLDDTDRVYSKVFAKPCFDAGSTALTGPYAVSSVASHEACEIEGDVFCNLYSDTGRGFLVATETADPVEADVYEIDDVAVSNFVTPEWFNPSAAPGVRLDYMERCAAPFSMTKGGYWIQSAAGAETQKFNDLVSWESEAGFDLRDNATVVFSPEMPHWKRELKMLHGRNFIKRTQIRSAA